MTTRAQTAAVIDDKITQADDSTSFTDVREATKAVNESAFNAEDDAAGITGRNVKGSYVANKLNLDVSGYSWSL